MSGPTIGRGAGVRAVPLTVIAGYLGAGKTTVLTHLLRHARARRVAVLVNDSVDADIDESLIRRRAGNDARALDRCIRCPSTSAVADALVELRRREGRLEHVLVEASGIAEAQLIAQYGFLPGYTLDGIIDVTDAEAIRSQASNAVIGPGILNQMWAADLIVLNKIDLVSQRERETVCDWLGRVIPDGRIVEASYGRLPPALLLGRRPTGDARLGRRPSGQGRAVQRHPREVGYSSWTWAGDEPMDEGAFRWWVGTLPHGILRAKGLLHLRSDPGSRVVFHLIGPHWSLRPEGPWRRERPRTAISLLGRAGSFDPHVLEMGIRQCSAAWPHRTPRSSAGH